jgi:putative FmdB family regulatory protein
MRKMRPRLELQNAAGEEEAAMPLYEFYCPHCREEVSMTLTVKEREQGAKCPKCRRGLEPRMATFFSKTSKKS